MSQIQHGTITLEHALGVSQALGIEPSDLVSLFMDAHHVEAVLFDRDEDGRRYIVHTRAGDQSSSQYAKRTVILRRSDMPAAVIGAEDGVTA